jgi:thiamine transport system substrate-binding protein
MKKWYIVLTLGVVLLTACTTPGNGTSGNGTPSAPAPTLSSPVAVQATEAPTAASPSVNGGRLTVMTHDSFSVSEEVAVAFQTQCNCTVQFLKSGDTGLALNKAILSKSAPLADVFFGVDNTFLGRALSADIFEPYQSPALADIPEELHLDPTNRLLPVDVGYVNLNYDKEYFQDNEIPLPQELRDLTGESYRGLIVVENPATSSPGLAFLAATVATFGEQGDYTYIDFWRDLKANDVLVTDGWEDAYYSQFSGGSGEGDRPIVVSYATSPAAEVFFADPQPAESPTGNLFVPGGSFRQVEFVGILKGTRQPELARLWIDFMLGPTFQADIPLQMWVYPARSETPLPEVFTEHATAPGDVVNTTPEQIDAGRETWIRSWTDTVLR